MTDGWTPERLLEEVRARVPWVSVYIHPLDPQPLKLPVRALPDEDDLLITFHWPGEPDLFGIRFHPSESPVGPSTGDVCESPEEWADEVAWVLTEELDPRLVNRARRSVTQTGVVELHHRPGR